MQLSERQRKSIAGLADVLLPAGGAIPQSATEAGVVATLEGLLGHWPQRSLRRFKALITAWDLGPLSARGFLKPFHMLGRDKQERWVELVHHSPRIDRRMPFSLLKQVVMLAFAASPAVEEKVGYDYTCRRDGEPHGRRETA
jgi:gluconate 2-dehydrogenase subunit 3-like protein